MKAENITSRAYAKKRAYTRKHEDEGTCEELLKEGWDHKIDHDFKIRTYMRKCEMGTATCAVKSKCLRDRSAHKRLETSARKVSPRCIHVQTNMHARRHTYARDVEGLLKRLHAERVLRGHDFVIDACTRTHAQRKERGGIQNETMWDTQEA